MGSVAMTNHAVIRKQQRGISGMMLDCLLEYGRICHDNRGAEILYFDKRARRRCLAAMSKEVYRKLDGHFDVYAIRSPDGAIITMGHRSRRMH